MTIDGRGHLTQQHFNLKLCIGLTITCVFASQRASKKRRTNNRSQRHSNRRCEEVLRKETLGKNPPPIRPKQSRPFSLFLSQTLTPEKEGKRKRLRNALAGRVREQLAAERRARRSFYIRALSIDH